jgi:predicted AAA+ superfamily ATPase
MKHFIERKAYIEKLLAYQDKDFIKVVTGLRRSGKSTLLELFRQRLYDSGVKVSNVQSMCS